MSSWIKKKNIIIQLLNKNKRLHEAMYSYSINLMPMEIIIVV